MVAAASKFFAPDPVAARAARHAAWLVAAFALTFGAFALGSDAHACYAAWSHHLYGAPPETRDAFLYSPAFAQMIWPLTLLPWPVFLGVWLFWVALAYMWLLAPLPYRWRIPLYLICLGLSAPGNVWAFIAIGVVLGSRRAAPWAFLLLTKVTPFLGPVWFAARRQWRNVVLTLAMPAAIIAVSYATDPHPGRTGSSYSRTAISTARCGQW